MRIADLIIGGVMGILGLLCLVEAHRLWKGWQGSGAIPLIVGVTFLFLSAAFLLFPSRETAALQWPSKKEMLGIGVIGGSFAIYISIMHWIGYPISTWIFLLVVARSISSSRLSITLIWTGVLAWGSYIVFKTCMGAYFPAGFLGI
jgi:hypothetical protein